MKENDQNIILFHFLFSLVIPLSIYTIFERINIVAMYLCFLLLLSNLGVRTYPEKMNGLIQIKGKKQQDKKLYRVSTILVYFLTLVGILLSITNSRGNYTIYSIPVFLVLFMLYVPFSTTGLEYVLKASNNFVKTSTPYQYRTNEHLILIGIVFTIFIAIFQFSLIEMIKITKYIG